MKIGYSNKQADRMNKEWHSKLIPDSCRLKDFRRK